jgi:hypothetical protein
VVLHSGEADRLLSRTLVRVMTFFMCWLFIIGLIMIGWTAWGFVPIVISVGFLLGGGA